MKHAILFLLGASLLLSISGAFQSNEKPDTIYFASLNKAIQLGQYDGVTTIKDLLIHGDFGVGSQEKLLSELVILDGVPYGIQADGIAKVLSSSSQIPFAAVKFFKADTSFEITHEMSLKQFQTFLDSVIGSNTFAAIKLKGNLSSIRYRSFYKQEKPYHPTKDALAKKFYKEDMQGTLVGYYTPRSAEVLNSPNYHFHVIDSDKKTGGHVLEGTISSGKVEIDFSRDLSVRLPNPSSLQHINLNK